MFTNFSSNIKKDLPSSIVVFLVALPLCLGIALASNAPLFSGLIAGIIGGTVVTAFSGSRLGVSGPAAGLTVIVAAAIIELGFAQFLTAALIAGIIQVLLGWFGAGIIAYYFPNSVIKGMLSGIGIVIIKKEIPYAFGYIKGEDETKELKEVFGHDFFMEFTDVFDYITPGAIVITLISLGILILWETNFFKGKKLFNWIQGPLVVVVVGILLNLLFNSVSELNLHLGAKNLVQIPVLSGEGSWKDLLTFPDLRGFLNVQVYITGAVLALVASLETLLCVEATDKLDPQKNITPTNKELRAQGIGNIVSSLIGGLPITQVIVRSSANMQSDAQSRLSAFLHGILLLICVLVIPKILNLIPLASLAAILFLVGYKLAKPSVFKSMWSKGKAQFIPFIVTILVIVFKDLLWGISVGLFIAILYILYENIKAPYFFKSKNYKPGDDIEILLSEHITFLNKGSILRTLQSVPDNSRVIIDASRTVSMHPDVLEMFDDFEDHAKSSNIDLVFKNLPKQELKSQAIKFSASGEVLKS